MLKFNKVIIDSFVYIVVPKISLIASIIILPWTSPYLSLEDYGIYGLIISCIAVFQVFISLGQHIVLQNSFFTHKKNFLMVWKRCFGLMILSAIVCIFLLFFISIFTFKDKLLDNFYFVFFLISIYLFLSPIETILINYYSLKEKSLPYALGMGLIGFVSSVITIITIIYLKLGYIGWVISLTFTSILTHLYFSRQIYFVEKIFPVFNFKRRFLISSLKVGLPLSPHQLSLYILSISDRLLLEYFKIPITELGFYSQGYSIGSHGSILVNGVFQAFNKKIQDAFRNESFLHTIFLRKAIVFIPLFISLILFLISLWAKEIFHILFNNRELQQSYLITIVVLCSYMFWGMYAFFVYPLSIQNNTFTISKTTMLAALINLVGNIILIPYFGIWGSLFVTYVSYFVFGFSGLLIKESRLFFEKYINIVKICFICFFINFLFLAISFFAFDLEYYIKLIISFFSILCFFIFFKFRKKFDL